jgi:hypothetical protein
MPPCCPTSSGSGGSRSCKAATGAETRRSRAAVAAAAVAARAAAAAGNAPLVGKQQLQHVVSQQELAAIIELLGPDADDDDFCPTCLEAYTDGVRQAVPCRAALSCCRCC